MTLFDIFYQHKEWWRDPNLGNDTQGKYGEVLKEMDNCALEYARSIKDAGDRWKRIIEKETRELCRPNYYSWNLRGDKKKWHDIVITDFLLYIKKAIEHCYGYDFKELPDSIRRQYGIEIIKLQQKDIAAPQQPDNGSSGELAGNGNESAIEGKQQPQQKSTTTNFKNKIAGNVDSEKLLAKLHTLMDGKTGKEALIYLTVCIIDGMINRPTFKQFEAEFPYICKRANYYRYTDPNNFTKNEKEAARKALDRNK